MVPPADTALLTIADNLHAMQNPTAHDPTAMGRTIREARLRKGMSLGQLAAAVGRSSSSVRRWERGEVPPAIGVVDQLAAVLDLDPDELRGLRPQTQPEPEESDDAVAWTNESDPDAIGAIPLVPPPVDDAPRRNERGFFGDVLAAFGDITRDWSGWVRGLLTFVVLLVMLVILVWALGQLGDALREIWDSFDAGSSG
jgi:transcriptional regulator with XRE-family HTH domain